jgi:hypothetical protein
MPYIKISKPPKHAKRNSGSCGDLVQYLEKENIGKELSEREMFFSHSEDIVFPEEVKQAIDNNKKGLKKTETKFYEMSISFSQKELQHIKSTIQDPEQQKAAIQGYIRNVMNEYAKQFNRTIDGRQLEGKDLVYFAKIEYSRRYHPEARDPELKKAYKHNYLLKAEIAEHKVNNNHSKVNQLEALYIKDFGGNIILPGNNKAGDNTHVHIIASRRDKSQTISLSPMSNSRGSKNKLNGKDVTIGFNRDQFAEKIENTFDKHFQFDRKHREKYRERKIAKDIKSNVQQLSHMIDDPDRFAEKYAKKLVIKTINKGVSEYLRSNGKDHLIKPIQQAIASNRSNLVNLAAQHLGKDLLTTGSVQVLASSIPTPVAVVMKAVMIAHSLLSGKDKDNSKTKGPELSR